MTLDDFLPLSDLPKYTYTIRVEKTAPTGETTDLGSFTFKTPQDLGISEVIAAVGMHGPRAVAEAQPE